MLRAILTGFGSLLAIAAGASYIWSILRGNTRPHRVTWTVWSLAGILGLWAAVDGGGGMGLVIAAIFVLTVTITAVLSFFPRYGKPGGHPSDYFVGALALIGLIIWRVADLSPSVAATIAIIADASVFWFTLRDAWRMPQHEPLYPWVIGTAAIALSLATLGNYNYASAAFVVYVLISDGMIVAVLLMHHRRRKYAR